MSRVNEVRRSSIPAVLLILYRRFHNIKEISEVIGKANIPRIYLAVDVPPLELQTEEYLLEREDSLKQLRQWCNDHQIELFVWIRKQNLGCARSVLTACEWFYGFEKFGAILEDDCIPTLEFFDFVSNSRSVLESDDEIYFICGTQHANIVQSSNEISFLFSSYPFLWGWATSREKWLKIVEVFLHFDQFGMASVKSKRETMYWRTGIRRASRRRVDVWDTIIVGFMALKGLSAILPLRNLINNRGIDEFATNHSKEIREKTWDLLLHSGDALKERENVDKSIREHFFRINHLMPLRNSIRWIADSLTAAKADDLAAKLASDFQEIPRDKADL